MTIFTFDIPVFFDAGSEGMKVLASPRGIVSLVFLALFVVASVLNVVFSYKDMLKARAISKPFCMGFLSLYAILILPTHWLIYVGALCGMAGDVIYLFKSNKKCVMIGAFMFYLGHVSYLAQVFLFLCAQGVFSLMYGWIGPLFAVVISLASVPYVRLLTGGDKLFTLNGVIYFTTALVYGAASIVGCFKGFASYLLLVVIGVMLFMASDSYLVYNMFAKKKMKKRNFIVMLTYLSAQALIVLGLTLTVLVNG